MAPWMTHSFPGCWSLGLTLLYLPPSITKHCVLPGLSFLLFKASFKLTTTQEVRALLFLAWTIAGANWGFSPPVSTAFPMHHPTGSLAFKAAHVSPSLAPPSACSISQLPSTSAVMFILVSSCLSGLLSCSSPPPPPSTAHVPLECVLCACLPLCTGFLFFDCLPHARNYYCSCQQWRYCPPDGGLPDSHLQTQCLFLSAPSFTCLCLSAGVWEARERLRLLPCICIMS